MSDEDDFARVWARLAENDRQDCLLAAASIGHPVPDALADRLDDASYGLPPVVSRASAGTKDAAVGWTKPIPRLRPAFADYVRARTWDR